MVALVKNRAIMALVTPSNGTALAMNSTINATTLAVNGPGLPTPGPAQQPQTLVQPRFPLFRNGTPIGRDGRPVSLRVHTANNPDIAESVVKARKTSIGQLAGLARVNVPEQQTKPLAKPATAQHKPEPVSTSATPSGNTKPEAPPRAPTSLTRVEHLSGAHGEILASDMYLRYSKRLQLLLDDRYLVRESDYQRSEVYTLHEPNEHVDKHAEHVGTTTDGKNIILLKYDHPLEFQDVNIEPGQVHLSVRDRIMEPTISKALQSAQGYTDATGDPKRTLRIVDEKPQEVTEVKGGVKTELMGRLHDGRYVVQTLPRAAPEPQTSATNPNTKSPNKDAPSNTTRSKTPPRAPTSLKRVDKLTGKRGEVLKDTYLTDRKLQQLLARKQKSIHKDTETIGYLVHGDGRDVNKGGTLMGKTLDGRNIGRYRYVHPKQFDTSAIKPGEILKNMKEYVFDGAKYKAMKGKGYAFTDGGQSYTLKIVENRPANVIDEDNGVWTDVMGRLLNGKYVVSISKHNAPRPPPSRSAHSTPPPETPSNPRPNPRRKTPSQPSPKTPPPPKRDSNPTSGTGYRWQTVGKWSPTNMTPNTVLSRLRSRADFKEIMQSLGEGKPFTIRSELNSKTFSTTYSTVKDKPVREFHFEANDDLTGTQTELMGRYGEAYIVRTSTAPLDFTAEQAYTANTHFQPKIIAATQLPAVFDEDLVRDNMTYKYHDYNGLIVEAQHVRTGDDDAQASGQMEHQSDSPRTGETKPTKHTKPAHPDAKSSNTTKKPTFKRKEVPKSNGTNADSTGAGNPDTQESNTTETPTSGEEKDSDKSNSGTHNTKNRRTPAPGHVDHPRAERDHRLHIITNDMQPAHEVPSQTTSPSSATPLNRITNAALGVRSTQEALEATLENTPEASASPLNEEAVQTREMVVYKPPSTLPSPPTPPQTSPRASPSPSRTWARTEPPIASTPSRPDDRTCDKDNYDARTNRFCKRFNELNYDRQLDPGNYAEDLTQIEGYQYYALKFILATSRHVKHDERTRRTQIGFINRKNCSKIPIAVENRDELKTCAKKRWTGPLQRDVLYYKRLDELGLWLCTPHENQNQLRIRASRDVSSTDAIDLKLMLLKHILNSPLVFPFRHAHKAQADKPFATVRLSFEVDKLLHGVPDSELVHFVNHELQAHKPEPGRKHNPFDRILLNATDGKILYDEVGTDHSRKMPTLKAQDFIANHAEQKEPRLNDGVVQAFMQHNVYKPLLRPKPKREYALFRSASEPLHFDDDRLVTEDQTLHEPPYVYDRTSLSKDEYNTFCINHDLLAHLGHYKKHVFAAAQCMAWKQYMACLHHAIEGTKVWFWSTDIKKISETWYPHATFRNGKLVYELKHEEGKWETNEHKAYTLSDANADDPRLPFLRELEKILQKSNSCQKHRAKKRRPAASTRSSTSAGASVPVSRSSEVPVIDQLLQLKREATVQTLFTRLLDIMWRQQGTECMVTVRKCADDAIQFDANIEHQAFAQSVFQLLASPWLHFAVQHSGTTDEYFAKYKLEANNALPICFLSTQKPGHIGVVHANAEKDVPEYFAVHHANGFAPSWLLLQVQDKFGLPPGHNWKTRDIVRPPRTRDERRHALDNATLLTATDIKANINRIADQKFNMFYYRARDLNDARMQQLHVIEDRYLNAFNIATPQARANYDKRIARAHKISANVGQIDGNVPAYEGQQTAVDALHTLQAYMHVMPHRFHGSLDTVRWMAGDRMSTADIALHDKTWKNNSVDSFVSDNVTGLDTDPRYQAAVQVFRWWSTLRESSD